MNPLLFFIVILIYIVCINILNEKFFHMQSDIALIFFTLISSAILLVLKQFISFDFLSRYIENVSKLEFSEYLMDGVLCFMLFAGASKVNMSKFKTNLRPIFLLAFLSTFISSFFFGALFYVFAIIFKLPMDFWTCVLLGCIVSPTDPIAATGILNKIGLSKNVCSVIENESLFNDGTGVTLFIFVRSMITSSGAGENFVTLMLREVLGAFIVAFVISFLFFSLLKITHNPINYIIISLLDVSLVYMICEHFGFSGVIASVVCGLFFSYEMNKIKRVAVVVDREHFYEHFWEILESLLNAILFVMIGLSILGADICKAFAVIIIATLFSLITSRFIGVLSSTLLTGKRVPGGYNLTEFSCLMTWSALKGGLSLALAMQTASIFDNDLFEMILTATYTAIFFSVLVQGLTVKNVYFALEDHKTKRIHGS